MTRGRGRLLVPPLPAATITFAQRGFRTGEPAVRDLLHRHAASFVDGYERQRRPGAVGIHDELATVATIERGFAYEGAAFAAAWADLVRPGPARRHPRSDGTLPGHLGRLLTGPGAHFVHLSHVGAGWLGAVLPWRLVLRRLPLDPLLRWLTLDGAGFARGFFGGQRGIRRLAGRRDRHTAVQAVLYQGVGRSLWFAENADIAAIDEQIRHFPPRLRAELWAGVGLAACYAGGRSTAALAQAVECSGLDRVALAQGAAFAAEARRRGGQTPAVTAAAVVELTGVPCATAAAWTRETATAARELGPGIDAYRFWQTKIRRRAGAVAR